jgi:hypothetical protein
VSSITYHKGIASFTEHGAAFGMELDDSFQVTNLDAFPDDPGPNGGLLAVDPYMGFSRGLIVLLRRVMGLRGHRFESEHALAQAKSEVESMYVCVHSPWTKAFGAPD